MEEIMNMFTLFILVAAGSAIFSLIFGISAMTSDGEIGHQTSAKWMTWRVLFQAAAFVLILLAMLGPHFGAH
jgi:hypothetical protein